MRPTAEELKIDVYFNNVDPYSFPYKIFVNEAEISKSQKQTTTSELDIYTDSSSET